MSIADITPQIILVHPTYFPPDECCHDGKCCAGILFSPAAGHGDEAEVRAMVFVNDTPVEEFDPKRLTSMCGLTGTCYVPEDIGIAIIRVQFRDQEGNTSFFSPPYYFAPKPIRMLA